MHENEKHLPSRTNGSNANANALLESVRRGLIALSRLVTNPKDIDGEMLMLWVAVLTKANIQPEEVQEAMVDYATENKFWPSPADIIAVVKKSRRERFYALGKHLALPEPEQSEEDRERVRAETLALHEIMKRDKPYLFDLTPSEKRSIPGERIVLREDTKEEIEEANRKREEMKARLKAVGGDGA